MKITSPKYIGKLVSFAEMKPGAIYVNAAASGLELQPVMRIMVNDCPHLLTLSASKAYLGTTVRTDRVYHEMDAELILEPKPA